MGTTDDSSNSQARAASRSLLESAMTSSGSQPIHTSAASSASGIESRETKPEAAGSSGKWSWGRILTLAGLVVLGVAPWAQAQLPPPNDPALCPPLTAFAGPTLFDTFWGTSPIRFPYQ